MRLTRVYCSLGLKYLLLAFSVNIATVGIFVSVAFSQDAAGTNVVLQGKDVKDVITSLNVISNGEPPFTTLRYALKQSERFSSVVHMFTNLDITIDKLKPQSVSSGWIQIPIELEVTKIGSDASANIEMIMGAPRLDEAQASNSLHISRIRDSISRITNTKCSYVFYPNGIVKDISCLSGNKDTDQQQVNYLLATTYAILPELPIGKNAQWLITTSIKNLAEPVKTMFQVKEINENQAVIFITTETSPTEHKLENVTMSTSAAGDLLSSIVSLQGEIIIQFNKPIPDMSIRGSISQTWNIPYKGIFAKSDTKQKETNTKMAVRMRVNTFAKGSM